MHKGVYILIKNFDVIYVGSSKDCERRIRQHKNIDYDYFVYLPTKKYKEWEWIFIAFLNPILNKQNRSLSKSIDHDKDTFRGLENGRRIKFYIN